MTVIRFLTFPEFTAPLLYEVLALRQRVFMIEQQRYYLDCDGRDQIALHGLAFDNETLCGYLRILPPGITYETAAIGRVVIDKGWRGKGVGDALMKEAQSRVEANWPGAGATLSAQIPTIAFYERLGFVCEGEEYIEAFTPHIKMVWEAKNPAFSAAKAPI